MQTLPALPQKFQQLLQLEKIERHHLDILTPIEKADFLQHIHAQIPLLHEEALDNFVEQTSSLLDKNEIWDFNHSKIAIIVERYVNENGCMPTTASIANASRLTRRTVRKHLEAFNSAPDQNDPTNSVGIMMPRIMGTVLKQALNGNLKAAKIYMDAAIKQKETTATVIKQNNHIQINNTIINQQLIQKLSPEKLKQIELLVTNKDEDTPIQ